MANSFLSRLLTIALLLGLWILVPSCGLVSLDGKSGHVRIEDPRHELLNYQYSAEHGWQRYLDLDKVNLFRQENGNPVSNKIVDDESLGTVHTFDIFAAILSEPTRSATDELWRVDAWVASGASAENYGYVVTFVLGYNDTMIEYELLPGYVFEWKSGETEQISKVVLELAPGEQVFMHIIGEHTFTEQDMAAIANFGFDYPELVTDHEENNMAILEALQAGHMPPQGEIRGLGLIYRGVQ